MVAEFFDGTSWLTGVVLVAALGYVAWFVVKDKLNQRKIDKLMDQLDQLGYLAGKLGKPPDFYKVEDVGQKFDWVDEFAVMQGWQRGFDEFVADNKARWEGLK